MATSEVGIRIRVDSSDVLSQIRRVSDALNALNRVAARTTIGSNVSIRGGAAGIRAAGATGIRSAGATDFVAGDVGELGLITPTGAPLRRPSSLGLGASGLITPTGAPLRRTPAAAGARRDSDSSVGGVAAGIGAILGGARGLLPALGFADAARRALTYGSALESVRNQLRSFSEGHFEANEQFERFRTLLEANSLSVSSFLPVLTSFARASIAAEQDITTVNRRAENIVGFITNRGFNEEQAASFVNVIDTIQARGRITGLELNTLQLLGVGSEDLARVLGTTPQGVRPLVATGTVTSETVLSGLLDRPIRGFSGRVRTLTDSLDDLRNALGRAGESVSVLASPLVIFGLDQFTAFARLWAQGVAIIGQEGASAGASAFQTLGQARAEIAGAIVEFLGNEDTPLGRAILEDRARFREAREAERRSEPFLGEPAFTVGLSAEEQERRRMQAEEAAAAAGAGVAPMRESTLDRFLENLDIAALGQETLNIATDSFSNELTNATTNLIGLTNVAVNFGSVLNMVASNLINRGLTAAVETGAEGLVTAVSRLFQGGQAES